MAKKVLIISSSPRKGGNSDLLCDEFMKGAIEAGNEVEKIFLKDKTVHPCTGCSVCSMYGKPCPQKDDAAEIVEKMIAADVIVMATSVYFYTMCGQMKIMIDRCCARYTEITNKEFYFIIAAAENDKAMMERTIDGFRGFLDCLEGPQKKQGKNLKKDSRKGKQKRKRQRKDWKNSVPKNRSRKNGNII